MPGKVNPVIPELVMQLSYRIRGAGTTVELAVAAGELELNVMEPVILDALTTSLADLTDAAPTSPTNASPDWYGILKHCNETSPVSGTITSRSPPAPATTLPQHPHRSDRTQVAVSAAASNRRGSVPEGRYGHTATARRFPHSLSSRVQSTGLCTHPQTPRPTVQTTGH